MLGEATVYEDGSALFTVPARTPVYFQALDDKGYVVQTMRSWSTLQPGENASCVGCHEYKNAAPPIAVSAAAGPASRRRAAASRSTARRGVQLRQRDPADPRPALHPLPRPPQPGKSPTSASWPARFPICASDGGATLYLALTPAASGVLLVNWVNVQSVPPMLRPTRPARGKSRLLPLLEAGHDDVACPPKLEKIACWIDLLVPYCGDYAEAHDWFDGEIAMYNRYLAVALRPTRRNAWSIEAMIGEAMPPSPLP